MLSIFVRAIGEALGLHEGMSVLDAGSTCGHSLAILQRQYRGRLRAMGALLGVGLGNVLGDPLPLLQTLGSIQSEYETLGTYIGRFEIWEICPSTPLLKRTAVEQSLSFLAII